MNFTMSWNEWFILLTAAVCTLVFLTIRKHFRLAVRILLWVYTVNFVEVFDYALAATPFRIYLCGDNTSYEISGGVLQFFIYPPYSFVFLYFYDKWKIHDNKRKTTLYIVCWIGFSIFFEWICLMNGVFTYLGWKLIYCRIVTRTNLYTPLNQRDFLYYAFLDRVLNKRVEILESKRRMDVFHSDYR